MLVDDDVAFLRVSKLILQLASRFEIDTAASVVEALEKLGGHSYDAVISDYEMPISNGLDFLKELREEGNNIPFIIFAFLDRDDIKAVAMDLGADRWVNKPGGASPEQVYSELASAILEAVDARKKVHSR